MTLPEAPDRRLPDRGEHAVIACQRCHDLKGLLPCRQESLWRPHRSTSSRAWMAEAEKSEPNDPNAMIVATATPDGRPSVRTVLLKGVDDRGFVFYTNKESRKGDELAANPHVALLFHWKSLRRQIRIEGTVEHGHRCGGGCLLRIARCGFRGWAPGRRSSRVRWRSEQFWRSGWRRWSGATQMKFRGRATGPGIGFCRKCSSSGRTCRIVCMIGRSIAGRRRGVGADETVSLADRSARTERTCNANANLHCS